jgi:hypothetical protein
MKNKNVFCVVAALVATLGLGLSARRAAADVTTTQVITQAAAGACHKPNNLGIAEYPWEGIHNKSTTENLFLDCSLFNGTGEESSTDSLSFAYAFGVDNSPSENLTCTVKIVSAQGYLATFTSTTSSSGTGAVFLNFSGMSGLGLIGNAYYSCKVPKATGTLTSNKSGIHTLVTGGYITHP